MTGEAERDAETTDRRGPHSEDRVRTGARRPRAAEGAKAKVMVRGDGGRRLEE